MTRTLVTGASTGIGFATALRLATEGHEVHASVRSTKSGEPLIEAASELDLSLLIMDVDDDESVSAAFDKLHTDHGPLDVLINNAGIASGGAIEDTPISEFKRIMNTNAWGTLRCIQAALPSMRERNAGHIINVTSLAGRVAQPGTAPYTASKWANEALSEILAIEAKPFGIRVSIVEPGAVKTPIFQKGTGASSRPTPYVGARRMREIFTSTLRSDPASPEFLAEAILNIINSQDAPLRTLVGRDAELLGATRQRLTDEEWIDRNSEPDDDVFRSWVGDAYGVKIETA